MKKTNLAIILTLVFFVSSCVTQKRKDEPSALKKFYHNTTAEFNGYFNADVIMQESTLALSTQHQENYNKILPVYDYVAARDPKPVAPELDRAIEKVSTVVTLHRISDWTDDCYLLLGQAQHLKKDYESAEETLEYTVGEFNPESIARKKAKYAKKYAKKARKKGGKPKKDKAKIAEQKAKKKDRAETKKEKEKAAKAKKKAREKEKKAKNKEIKKRKKARKKGKSYKKQKATTPTPPQPSTTTPTTPKVTETPKKEEEKKKKKKDEPKIAEDKEKPFKREPAYQDARLWLARTYIEREKYERAEDIFMDLEGKSNTYKHVKAELAPATAHLYLKQRKYEEAIPWLEKAIDRTKDRQDRARYSFILAQLFQRQKDATQAYAYFQKAQRMSNDYEMSFNAQLSMAQNEYRSGKNTPEGTIKKLERFLKDANNAEYKDQIYFALGNVALESNQKNQAIGYFEKSLEFNSGNSAQKGETLVALADLFYEQDAFVDAKKYYEQSLPIIGETDERYDRIDRLAKNLDEIATNIEIVTLQDSLLMIAGLDDKARKALAKELKKAQKDSAVAATKGGAANKRGVPTATTATSITLSSNRGLRTAPSTFPFYSEKNAKKGQKDFERIYGDRQLADDWRRSNREGFTDIVLDDVEEEKVEEELSQSEIEQLFKDVPKTEEEKALAGRQIQDAMIALGRLFRERIERDDQAIDILEDRLLVEYPRTKYELDAWYYLYLSHTNENNTAQAQEYKDKLIKKYPTTTFARILSDPNYAASVMNERKLISQYYDEAYGQFEQGNYKAAYEKSTKSVELYGKENPLIAKFALLSAICTGNITGKDEYIIALRNVIAKHPDTPEQTRAKEILRLLEGRGSTARATDSENEVEAAKNYIYEEAKLHYMLIVITDKGDVKINDAKSSIAGFNRLNNKLDKLRISNIYLGTDTNRPIMVIRKFKNKERAMVYYESALDGGDEFIPEGMQYEIYPITQNNYRQVLKNKSLDGYATFFEDNYLN